MASVTVLEHFICHICFTKFFDQSSLISHFSHCDLKPSIKRNDETIRVPRLNKTDRDLLHILKLHRSNDKLISHKSKDLEIPINSSKQSSFDDSICNTPHYLLINNNHIEQENISNNLNTKFSSSLCHIYKYSRREQKNFYTSVKKARLKKHYLLPKKSRINSSIFNHKNVFINLPTKINSRQRLNRNSNNSYPLIFDPNFNTLVQNSTNNILQNYFSNINSYFHLIHSIASQEFQTIVNSNDNQHQVSYTAFSFLNTLRQTMNDYSINLQKTLKRNYFQSFQSNVTSFKIPRYDQPSSSHIQIEDNHHPSIPIINNLRSTENNSSVRQPVQPDLILIDRQQPTKSVTTFIPIIERQKSPSPIFLKEHKIEPIEYDESTDIRLVNGSNHTKKSSSSRKKLSNSTNKISENTIVKSTRMSTRQHSIKTEIVTDIYPSYETKPVILTSNQISQEWSTHTVFYRCHACSHEEFFVVLSRECMNLHISSHHGNMEENFKQRLSTFINNKGRSLKLFQHYLKWQQPWSEKQIEQIFKLSNKS